MRKILITGGAGFIGSNAAAYFADQGWQVHILDNMQRKGAESNLKWLNANHRIQLHRIDIRDSLSVEECVSRLKPELLVHLAAQVAVTTSVIDPRHDFEVNAQGTFNLLEAVRKHSPGTFFINASTNKVYGKLEHLAIEESGSRYQYKNLPEGVAESESLSFYSPYGCSKGAADQYVVDYGRIYDLSTVTFRQSCIYGPRQFGVEDQGWIAWFTIATVLKKKITIYGDGKQIRDILHVDDLIRAYEAAYERRDSLSKGEVFNVGGGAENTLSLLELVVFLKKHFNEDIPFDSADWRPGDQKVFVSDNRKARRLLNWDCKIAIDQGLTMLADWVANNKALF